MKRGLHGQKLAVSMVEPCDVPRSFNVHVEVLRDQSRHHTFNFWLKLLHDHTIMSLSIIEGDGSCDILQLRCIVEQLVFLRLLIEIMFLPVPCKPVVGEVVPVRRVDDIGVGHC